MSEEKQDIPSFAKMTKLIYTPRFMLAAVGVYGGVILAYLGISGFQDNMFFDMLKEKGIVFLGGIVSFYSMIYLTSEMRKLRLERSRTFSDVDRDFKNSEDHLSYRILEELNKIRDESKPIDYDEIQKLIEDSKESEREKIEHETKDFESYFLGIKISLEKRATAADEKASILLERGISYGRLGILLYLMCILIWQVLTWIYGYKPQVIYGIASTSLLFVFIEFLSAWFLKQYRNFVDTSTYLIKVKSIFDRHMLAYTLAMQSSDEDCRHAMRLELLNGLQADIKWPDSYLGKKADISFAREAVESMSEAVKSIQQFQRKTNNGEQGVGGNG